MNKLVRIDPKMVERLEAYRKVASEKAGFNVSFAQTVRLVLLKGFAAIDAQPRKGAR